MIYSFSNNIIVCWQPHDAPHAERINRLKLLCTVGVRMIVRIVIFIRSLLAYLFMSLSRVSTCVTHVHGASKFKFPTIRNLSLLDCADISSSRIPKWDTEQWQTANPLPYVQPYIELKYYRCHQAHSLRSRLEKTRCTNTLYPTGSGIYFIFMHHEWVPFCLCPIICASPDVANLLP